LTYGILLIYLFVRPEIAREPIWKTAFCRAGLKFRFIPATGTNRIQADDAESGDSAGAENNGSSGIHKNLQVNGGWTKWTRKRKKKNTLQARFVSRF